MSALASHCLSQTSHLFPLITEQVFLLTHDESASSVFNDNPSNYPSILTIGR